MWKIDVVMQRKSFSENKVFKLHAAVQRQNFPFLFLQQSVHVLTLLCGHNGRQFANSMLGMDIVTFDLVG